MQEKDEVQENQILGEIVEISDQPKREVPDFDLDYDEEIPGIITLG